MASAAYRVQARVAGDWRGSIPQARVAGVHRNPATIFVKVSGVWRISYQQISWTYSWQVDGWTACGAVGTYQTRSVWCQREPDNVVMADGYCNAGTRPASTQICNCNCNCACACCCD